MPNSQPPTAAEIRAAQKLVAQMQPKLARLPKAALDRLSIVADAFLTGSDEEIEHLQAIIETQPLDLDAVVIAALDIVERDR